MCKFIPGYDNFNLCVDGWAFLLSFTSPMWTLTGCKSRSTSVDTASKPWTFQDDSAAHVSEEVGLALLLV